MNKPSESETSHRTVSRDWLTRFVQKYYLGGIIDEVRWVCQNGVWEVKEINTDGKWEWYNGEYQFRPSKSHKKLMVVIRSKCHWELPFEFVPDNKVLLGLLPILDEEIAINVLNPSDCGLEYVMLPEVELTDGGNAVILVSEDTEHLPSNPKLLRDVSWDYTSTFRTVDMLDYLEYFGRGRFRSRKEKYLNQHLFKFKPITWFDFDGYHLRNILRSNMDVDVFTMEVSKQGLCHLSFNGDDIQSEYYLIKYGFEEPDDGEHSFHYIESNS